MTLRVLEKEALELPPRSRVRLAEKLIESIDDYSDPKLELEWDHEIERRVTEIERGSAGRAVLRRGPNMFSGSLRAVRQHPREGRALRVPKT